MEDNREQYKRLAKSKREADDYHPMLSPEVERIARFFWWIIGGILFGTILVTIWVTNINVNMSKFETRITANESYRDTSKARFTADDLTHLQTNQSIQDIRKELDARSPMIKEHQELWFMKEHGISNREDFRRKHGYDAPTSEPEPSPRK